MNMMSAYSAFANIRAAAPLANAIRWPAHRSQSIRSIGARSRRRRIVCSDISANAVNSDILSALEVGAMLGIAAILDASGNL